MPDLIRKMSDLIPKMLMDVPRCEEGLLFRTLREQAREFCEMTEAWRIELRAINIVTDQVEYTLPVPWDASIHRIILVTINDIERVDTQYDLEDERKLILDDSIKPTEDITDGLEVEVVLRPHESTDDYPEAFFDRWHSAIVAGAKATLLNQPKKPWTNPRLAKRFTTQWVTGKALARREKYAKQKAGGLKLQHQPFL